MKAMGHLEALGLGARAEASGATKLGTNVRELLLKRLTASMPNNYDMNGDDEPAGSVEAPSQSPRRDISDPRST